MRCICGTCHKCKDREAKRKKKSPGYVSRILQEGSSEALREQKEAAKAAKEAAQERLRQEKCAAKEARKAAKERKDAAFKHNVEKYGLSKACKMAVMIAKKRDGVFFCVGKSYRHKVEWMRTHPPAKRNTE